MYHSWISYRISDFNSGLDFLCWDALGNPRRSVHQAMWYTSWVPTASQHLSILNPDTQPTGPIRSTNSHSTLWAQWHADHALRPKTNIYNNSFQQCLSDTCKCQRILSFGIPSLNQRRDWYISNCYCQCAIPYPTYEDGIKKNWTTILH